MDDRRDPLELVSRLSDTEQLAAEASLSQAKGRLEAVDTEIAQIQRHLHSLLEQRVEEARHVDELRTLVATYKKLPPELVGKIFVKCVEENIVVIPPDFYTRPLWRLGRICSGWRKVWSAEPRLWDRLLIKEMRPLNKSLEILEYIVTRTGTSPFKVFIGTVVHRLGIATHSILIRFSPRVKKLKFCADPSMMVMISAGSYRFESLESLNIHFEHVDNPLRRVPNFTIFAAGSKLRSLKIQGIYSPWSDTPSTTIGLDATLFCWDHLTKLVISYRVQISLTIFLEILKKATKLRFCHVVVSGEVEQPQEMQMPSSLITLDSLHSLCISADGSVEQHLESLLAILLCPELKALDLPEGNSLIPWPQEGILKLVSRSRTMQEFLGNCSRAPPGCVERLMRAMPSLTRFILNTSGPVAESLLDKMRTENLLPNLQKLNVWVSSARAIFELLQSRWSNDSSVKNPGIETIILHTTNAVRRDHKNAFDILESAYGERGGSIYYLTATENQ